MPPLHLLGEYESLTQQHQEQLIPALTQRSQILLSDRGMFNDFGNSIWVGNHHDMGRAIDNDCLIRVSSLCHK